MPALYTQLLGFPPPPPFDPCLERFLTLPFLIDRVKNKNLLINQRFIHSRVERSRIRTFKGKSSKRVESISIARPWRQGLRFVAKMQNAANPSFCRTMISFRRGSRDLVANIGRKGSKLINHEIDQLLLLFFNFPT